MRTANRWAHSHFVGFVMSRVICMNDVRAHPIVRVSILYLIHAYFTVFFSTDNCQDPSPRSKFRRSHRCKTVPSRTLWKQIVFGKGFSGGRHCFPYFFIKHKLRKRDETAKTRNQYNRIPHPAPDTQWERNTHATEMA